MKQLPQKSLFTKILFDKYEVQVAQKNAFRKKDNLYKKQNLFAKNMSFAHKDNCHRNPFTQKSSCTRNPLHKVHLTQNAMQTNKHN